MNRSLIAAIVAAGMFAALPARAVAQSQDETSIRTLAMQQSATWNRHDPTAYAALFTEDCDVVNVVGWWWKGRAEFERKLAAAFVYVFRESALTIGEVQVRFLSPEVAWRMHAGRWWGPEPQQESPSLERAFRRSSSPDARASG